MSVWNKSSAMRDGASQWFDGRVWACLSGSREWWGMRRRSVRIAQLFMGAALLFMGNCVAGDIDGTPVETLCEIAQHSGNDANALPAPTAHLTLSEVLELVFSRNPDLEAYMWRTRAADAHTVQSGKLPNPRLSVTADELRVTDGPKTVTRISRYGEDPKSRERVEAGVPAGVGDVELTVALSQKMELGGKRAKRVQLARKERELCDREYDALKARVQREAVADFYTLLTVQEYVQVCEEPLHCATLLVDKLCKSGFPVKDVNAAEVMRAKYEIEWERAKRQLEAARIRLAAAWGETEACFECVVGDPDPIVPLPAKEDLLKWLDNNVESNKCAAQVEVARANVALEKANAIPDMEVRCAFRTDRSPDRHASGTGIGDGIELEQRRVRSEGKWDNTFMIGVSIDLPLFDRRQGAIEEARDMFLNACANQKSAMVSVKTEMLSLREEMVASLEEIRTLNNQVIPTLARTMESIRKGMEIGAFTQVDLMKAVQENHDAHRQLRDARIDYFEGRAAMEELTGKSLEATEN